MTRFYIPDFGLANPIYQGARIHIYLVDDDGVITDDLATLYAATTGSARLTNPQKLDGHGKFSAPVYVDGDEAEDGVICTVTGLSIPDHSTGVIRTPAPSGLRYALVYPSANVVNPSYPYTILFVSEDRDTDAIHSASLNTSRLTVPAGVTGVRLTGQVGWTSTVAAAAGTTLKIYKNGSLVYTGVGLSIGQETYYTDASLKVQSAILQVTAGDYFELVVDCTDVTSTIDATKTWFQMEILEG